MTPGGRSRKVYVVTAPASIRGIYEEIRGAYHHLVLDRPEAFVHELRGFLDALDAGAIRAREPRAARPAAS